MDAIIEWMLSPKPYLCVATALISLVAWAMIRRFVRKVFGKTDKQSGAISIILNIVKYFIVILCVLLILQINGIDVTSAVAGLGIASVIVGLALQDALKDIIMGVNIISEEFFRIGDVIKVDNYVGRVTSMSLKSTRIVNAEEGYEVRICNRNIDRVFRYNDVMFLDIPLAYGESPDKIRDVFGEIVKEISSWKDIKKVEFLGLQEFQDSSICYRLRIMAPPTKRADTKRRALQKIDELFRQNGISIPFPQLDIHTDS
ncbi:MAG: mechanosensitive ion channel family protein [Clostridiales bacterium]|nr:mechanosensitive ion channel family protein [Clostridiales bacterium]